MIRAGLWVRLSFAMAVLAVAPVVIFTLTAVNIATRAAEEASQEALRREAGQQAEMVALWMEDQARLVLAWPLVFAGDRLLELSPEAQERFPIAVYRGTPNAATVLLVDGEGRSVGRPIFATTPGERPVGSGPRAQQLVERLPLADALTRPEVVHVGDAWFPEDGGKPSLPMAVLAAGGPTPQERRVLAVELVLDLGHALLATTTTTHAVAVLDRNGMPLIGGDHPLVRPDRLRPLLGTDQVVDFKEPGADDEVWGAIVPIASTPGWSLVVAEPASVVLQGVQEIPEYVTLFLLGATLFAVLVALVVASSLSRPVELLRDAVLEVAEGRFGASPQIRRNDEIGDLARAFDHMSERLRANRREIGAQQERIEAFNRELQQRVDERTRELEEAQHELVRTGQLAAVAELGAGLAHELNNPLAAVLGLAQLLRARDPSDPELAALEQQAARCREVVVTLQRVQAQEVEPRHVPVVAVREILREVAELVAGPFRQRGVALRMQEEVPGSVRADPSQAARVIAQLLNALRAGLESGAAVDVRCRAEGEEVLLLREADHDVASHPDRRDDWMASGHGLWVARQLLDRLGGKLEAEGRVWRVSLPAA